MYSFFRIGNLCVSNSKLLWCITCLRVKFKLFIYSFINLKAVMYVYFQKIIAVHPLYCTVHKRLISMTISTVLTFELTQA